MNKEYESNVISLSKIWENLKKYFWVIIVCVIASLGISYLVAGAEADPVTVITKKVYGADISIRINWAVDVDNLDETTLLYCQEDNKALAKYLYTTEYLKLLNEKLTENGYPILASNEKISFDAGSYNLTRIAACGYAENGRLEFILDTTVELLEAEAKELYGITSLEIISMPYLQNVKETNGNYTFIYGAVADPDQQPTAAPVLSTMDKWKQNTNFMIYILAGIIFGAFAVFMIMVFDDKVYTTTEIAQTLKTPCLGNSKSEGQQVLLAEKVIGKCKKDNLGEVGVLVLGKAADSVAAVEEQLKEASIHTEIVKDIETSGASMKSLSKTENVIIGIELKKTHKKQITWTMETLEYFGINVIGYFCY